MRRAQLSPLARQDALHALHWIGLNTPGATRSFRVAFDKATRMLGEHPLAGRERPDLTRAPVRFLTLPGFPYIFVYNAKAVPPLILRVLHGARDLPEVVEDLIPPGFDA